MQNNINEIVDMVFNEIRTKYKAEDVEGIIEMDKFYFFKTHQPYLIKAMNERMIQKFESNKQKRKPNGRFC